MPFKCTFILSLYIYFITAIMPGTDIADGYKARQDSNVI